MKLRFFNGRGKEDDEGRLSAVNASVHTTGLAFELFKINQVPVYFSDVLYRGMRKAPSEIHGPTIALLHFTECPNLGASFPKWNEMRLRNLIIVLFSGAGLDDTVLKPIRAAGKAARLGGLFWFRQGFSESVKNKRFTSFFKWLAGERSPTVEAINKKLDEWLCTTGPEMGPYLKALQRLCWGYEDSQKPGAATRGKMLSCRLSWWSSAMMEHPESREEQGAVWNEINRELMALGIVEDDAKYETVRRFFRKLSDVSSELPETIGSNDVKAIKVVLDELDKKNGGAT